MTIFNEVVQDGKLISEEKWLKLMESMENGFDDLETNNERAKHELAESILNSMKKRAAPKFGILFSGGVDSTLISFIAKKLNADFTCYTVGLENSDDLNWAKKIAGEYGFRWKYRLLTLDELENVLRKVIEILGDTEIVKVSVGSVLFAGGKLSVADGNNILFGGLGSEEIFAGYQRHLDAMQDNNYEALHKECWNGLKNMWKRDLVRDFSIAKSLGLELRTPFLDIGLVKCAMNIHPMLKLDKGEKKIILREAAEFIGLKKEFAWRKKQAAQYGSGFVDGIEKLAKRKGFRYKKDYLESLVRK